MIAANGGQCSFEWTSTIGLVERTASRPYSDRYSCQSKDRARRGRESLTLLPLSDTPNPADKIGKRGFKRGPFPGRGCGGCLGRSRYPPAPKHLSTCTDSCSEGHFSVGCRDEHRGSRFERFAKVAAGAVRVRAARGAPPRGTFQRGTQWRARIPVGRRRQPGQAALPRRRLDGGGPRAAADRRRHTCRWTRTRLSTRLWASCGRRGLPSERSASGSTWPQPQFRTSASSRRFKSSSRTRSNVRDARSWRNATRSKHENPWTGLCPCVTIPRPLPTWSPQSVLGSSSVTRASQRRRSSQRTSMQTFPSEMPKGLRRKSRRH